MAEKTDFVGLGFCSNDYLATLPNIPMDSKVQILEHLIQGGGPAATSTVAASRLGTNYRCTFVGSRRSYRHIAEWHGVGAAGICPSKPPWVRLSSA